MKKWCTGLVLGLCALVVCGSEAGDKIRHEKAAEMLKRLTEYQADTPDTAPVRRLKVIYVYPKDMAPHARYQERINGLFNDFSDFLRTEFKRNGFGERDMALERDEQNNVVIHMVKGLHNADSYSYKEGQLVVKDIRAALNDKFNIDDETLMIFCGFSRTQPDGVIRIFAPYYGYSPWEKAWGKAFLMDHELLDINGLTDSKTKLKVHEHHQRDMTVSSFNNTYIGGAFHELGHALSLPHNVKMDDEAEIGAALMGDGNYFYRADRQGSKGRTYLSFTETSRMISLPLFSGSSKEYNRRAKVTLENFSWTADSENMTIRGLIKSDIPPYVLTVYADPANKKDDTYPVNADYDVLNWVVIPERDGSFTCTFPMKKLISGEWQLRLTPCFLNGNYATVKKQIFNGINLKK